MKKKDKLIGLTADTKRELSKKAIEADKSLKLFCEDILEGAVNPVIFKDGKVAVSGDVADAMKESSRNASKEKKKDNYEHFEGGGPVVADEPMDKSGTFKHADTHIYTNGKCFKVKRLVKGNLQEEYFPDIDAAKKYLKG